jgi:biotin synthase
MNQTQKLISFCKEQVLAERNITIENASFLFNLNNFFLTQLSDAANEITRKFHGSKIDLEQLANIKKNYCSEDCSFCSQSAFFDTGIDKYELMSPEEVVKEAMKAKQSGADSYCLVAAWKEPSRDDFTKVCNIIKEVNDKVDISIECSLGFLTTEQAITLKQLGVIRYNHNLETSKSKFPDICTTHTYQDRVNTLNIAKNAGLELCTGGIIGIGETKKQREELIFEIASFQPEEVTINLLVPIPGTPLEIQKPVKIEEIIRVFATLRFLLPKSIIKISGGREVNLVDDGQKLLLSGANGIISSGYLTMDGNSPEKDIKMLKKINLEV